MQMNGQIVLASNATTGNGTAFQWAGGKGMFLAEATWGGGSAKLQSITPNGSWIDVPSVSLTANGQVAFELPAGQIRVVIATSTAVYAYACGIPQTGQKGDTGNTGDVGPAGADGADGAGANVPAWVKYSVSYSNFSDASMAKSYTLFTLPAKSIVTATIIKPTTAFTGGSISGYALSVGNPDLGASELINNIDVFSAVSDTNFSTNTSPVVTMFSFNSATTIAVTANSADDTLNHATAGAADIWVLVSTLP